MKMGRLLLCAVCMLIGLHTDRLSANDSFVNVSDCVRAGTTWTCVSKSVRGLEVKSYFAFLPSNKVLWLLGTPGGNVFPVGLGTYRNENNICRMSYMASEPLHKKISLYYGDNNIHFYITVDNNSELSILSVSNDPFIFDGATYILRRHDIHFGPSSSLMNQIWAAEDGTRIKFKNEHEAVIVTGDGDSWPVLYYCRDKGKGGYVSIKSGDNLSDENLIGTWESEYQKYYDYDLNRTVESYITEMRLHREGLDEVGQEFLFRRLY